MNKPDFLTQTEFYILTTHLLHLVVFNRKILHFEDEVDLINYYLVNVEKPPEIKNLFNHPTISFMAFILRFLINEFPNANRYEKINPKPNIKLLNEKSA